MVVRSVALHHILVWIFGFAHGACIIIVRYLLLYYTHMVSRTTAHDITEMLNKEKEELIEIFDAIKAKETLAENVNDSFDEVTTYGERVADKIANFGGSWAFIISFIVLLVFWIVLNLSLPNPIDEFPFILLNLALSTLASLQWPVIMMSQKRQEVRDRLRAENDYKVNLKAEVEIRTLHEKIDHLLVKKRDNLIEIQQIQLKILEGKHNAD